MTDCVKDIQVGSSFISGPVLATSQKNRTESFLFHKSFRYKTTNINVQYLYIFIIQLISPTIYKCMKNSTYVIVKKNLKDCYLIALSSIRPSLNLGLQEYILITIDGFQEEFKKRSLHFLRLTFVSV